MAKSGPTAIAFTPRMCFIAGLLAALVAVVSFIAATKAHMVFGYVVAVFWVGVSAYSFWYSRKSPA